MKDADTSEPLSNANVFLANTTLGAVTDENGFYAISHVPLGTHELYVSLIGYEAKKLTLRLTTPNDVQIDLNLKAKPVVLPSIDIVATPSRDMRNWSLPTLGRKTNGRKIAAMPF